MRKIFILLFIFSLVSTEDVRSEVISDELIDMITISEQTGLTTDMWEITIKEKTPIKKIKNNVKKLTDSFEVTKHYDDSFTKYTLDNTHKYEIISVSYKAVIPDNPYQEGEWIAIISGQEWNEQIQTEYEEIRNSTKDNFFSQNAHKFTCLQAHNGGILNEVTLDQVKKSFNIKHQESLADNMQKSVIREEIYGYTNMWNEKITILDKPMNIHIALIHSANGKEKFIIGTPILINEY